MASPNKSDSQRHPNQPNQRGAYRGGRGGYANGNSKPRAQIRPSPEQYHNNHRGTSRGGRGSTQRNHGFINNRGSYDNTQMRQLTYYLRHGGQDAGLNVRRDGYVKVDDILSLRDFQRYGASLDVVQSIVRDCRKQRFSLKRETDAWAGEVWWIRANQGHSMKCVDTSALLTRLTHKDINRFPVVCHGTYWKAWKLIEREGLKTMTRNHIHMVPSDTIRGRRGVISWVRSSCELFIYIDLVSAMRDGIEFFVSQNNIILTAGIEGVLAPKYFEKVARFAKGKAGEVIWRRQQ